jgi:hypothetical protein
MILAWTLLIGSLGATPPCMWLWYSGRISEKDMVGLTLLLSLLALAFSAVTTLFVV